MVSSKQPEGEKILEEEKKKRKKEEKNQENGRKKEKKKEKKKTSESKSIITNLPMSQKTIFRRNRGIKVGSKTEKISISKIIRVRIFRSWWSNSNIHGVASLRNGEDHLGKGRRSVGERGERERERKKRIFHT